MDNPRASLSAQHRFELRVYFEDTDLAGIVYHANYLKFAERARSEWLRQLGIPVSTIKLEFAIVPVIKSAHLDFIQPARMDDLLAVTTNIISKRATGMELQQTIVRADDQTELCRVQVMVVWINASGRPVRLPQKIQQALDKGL